MCGQARLDRTLLINGFKIKTVVLVIVDAKGMIDKISQTTSGDRIL